MIRNIIFDLGNVLLNFNPERFLSVRYDKDKGKRILREVFQSEEWLMLDKGVITQEEAIEVLSRRFPMDSSTIEQVFQEWTEMLTPIYGTVEILEKLKENDYRLYVLSNFHILAFNKVYRDYSFFQLFDGMIISSKVKKLKPELEIYYELINRYSINPEESIFIDDIPENLKGAEKAGLRTILFRSPEDLLSELRKYGII
ncbi:MAG: HAD family phosphatase [Halanaerobiaceae bacterium]|nr:HAD family phosphatase [Halanaerobiaceae bacterium]